MSLTADEIIQINKVYYYLANSQGLSFQILTSAIVVLYSMMMIIMLQGTAKLGEMIMMVT